MSSPEPLIEKFLKTINKDKYWKIPNLSKSLIISINKRHLIYEKNFIIPPKDQISYFLLEIRSDLMKDAHSNAMIIYQNKLYRFEPYGSLVAINLLYPFEIVDEFLKIFFKEFKYIRPRDYQAVMGPQSLEESDLRHPYQGFCVAWSYLFIEMFLEKLDISKEIDVISHNYDVIKDHKIFIINYIKNLKTLENI